MAKKKKGKKKKGKKGKKGKKSRVGPAPPYYPVVLTADYKFGQIIATTIAEKKKNDSEAAHRVREGGIRCSGRDGEDDRLLSLSRLTLDELPLGLSSLKMNLTALDLSSNQLFDIDIVGNAISQCYELREINLNNNNLTGTLPNCICNLSRLELFSADNNHITSLPIDFAKKCTNMITLSFQNNQLKEIPSSFAVEGMWSNLHRLNVSRNQLIAIPANIGCFGRLEVLKCGQNTIAVIPSSIGDLTRLKLLDFRSNALLSLPIELEHCQELNVLNVSGNGLTRLDGALLEALGSAGLRQLYCYKNKIATLPSSIGHIGTLEILSIANNKLTSLPEEIGGLSNLQELYVGGNVGLKNIPSSCKGWNSIRALYAQNCGKLKSLPMQLAWCKNLRDLNVLSAKKKQTVVIFKSLLAYLPLMRVRGGKIKKDKKGKGTGGAPTMLPPPP